ncbi:MAG TPA: hypothetical protein VF717_10975 [Pyrinomonadaceae bacterium]|jgi:hypothetical protein
MRFPTEEKRTGRCIGRPLLSLSSFMLAIAVGLISSFTFSAAYDLARGAFEAEPAAVAGVWHGHWNGVHAVTLRLEQGCESLSGTARFSRVIQTGDGLKVIGESAEVPLINPQLRGDMLTFEIKNPEVSTAAATIGLEMRFTKQGEAELCREQEQPGREESWTITMLQEPSF